VRRTAWNVRSITPPAGYEGWPWWSLHPLCEVVYNIDEYSRRLETTAMVMDPETIALHEAGHAVMQWFVGWEADLQFIQMQRVDGGVQKSFMKTSTPNRKTYSDIQVARKKLLVLLAGAATTDDPAAQPSTTGVTLTKRALSCVSYLTAPSSGFPEPMWRSNKTDQMTCCRMPMQRVRTFFTTRRSRAQSRPCRSDYSLRNATGREYAPWARMTSSRFASGSAGI